MGEKPGENRFVTRETTIQEMLWASKAMQGDAESIVLLLESRRVDKSWNLRDLPSSMLPQLAEEMAQTIKGSSGYSALDIQRLVKEVDDDLRNHREGDD